jgi:hypothetical protein
MAIQHSLWTPIIPKPIGKMASSDDNEENGNRAGVVHTFWHI